MSLWGPFQAAGGIVIPWQMATVDGTDHLTDDPDFPARAVLFHAPGGHLGAVDPTQTLPEQTKQWQKMAGDSVNCRLCGSFDWNSQEWAPHQSPLLAVGYVGFFDRVPALRDLEAELDE